MARKSKLKRFADLYTFDNVYQNHSATEAIIFDKNQQQVDLSGQWGAQHFKNNHPIVLELACGKGDYVRQLAKAYPQQNFIGVDLKGNRIWVGAKACLEDGLNNAAFLRTRIEQLGGIFAPNEVDEIWITFPDPYLREGKSNKRLTSPRFLPQYKKLLKSGGIVHLKTDDDTLYAYTLETLKEQNATILYHSDNIYASALAYPELDFKTHYEGQHLANGLTIKYIRFQLP